MLPTPEASDRGAVRFEIASSGADSVTTEFLRLSAFQFAIVCRILTSGSSLNVDLEPGIYLPLFFYSPFAFILLFLAKTKKASKIFGEVPKKGQVKGTDFWNSRRRR